MIISGAIEIKHLQPWLYLSQQQNITFGIIVPI